MCFYIKSLKYYYSCMVYDILNYKSVRNKIYFIFLLSIVSVLYSYFLLKDETIFYLFVPITMLGVLWFSWFYGYYKTIYPRITRLENELRLQLKYPYMYDKFLKKE